MRTGRSFPCLTASRFPELCFPSRIITKVPSFSFDFFKNGNNIKYVDSNLKALYLKEIKKLIADKEGFKKNAAQITVVYTPLHGAGAKMDSELLKECGVSDLHTVKEQMQPDGDFPTVKLPNPEDPAAFEMALALAKEVQADLVLASDPDSDRTGVYAKTPDGGYAMLNGNQIGVLLLERIIESRNARKMMPVNPFVVSTVVSTRLTKRICEANSIEYVDVLTGFKFIGEKIMELDEHGDKNFLFGFEESYGYLPGTYARDKDAVADAFSRRRRRRIMRLRGKRFSKRWTIFIKNTAITTKCRFPSISRANPACE